jgi:hypothetical protein
MKTRFQFSFTIVVLFLFTGLSAQDLPFELGRITLKSGERMNGYIMLLNSQKVAFKKLPNSAPIKYKAKNVAQFNYDGKLFESIDYDKKTFFVRKIVRGKISLYKRDLAPKSKAAYFVKTDKIFTPVTEAQRYEIFKSIMGKFTVFENYNKDLFEVAYSYNQIELIELVNSYNAENRANSIAMDYFSAERDTSIYDEVIGFATYNAYGTGSSNTQSTRIPNTVRNDLALKTEIIYDQIFEGLESRNWKKIENALRFLKPLATEIEAFKNQDLYTDLLTYARLKQKNNFTEVFVIFVSHGVQFLLKTANLQDQTMMRKIVIRQAFVEFLEISEELKKSNPTLAHKIMKQFKIAFSSASNPQRFTTEVFKIQVSFKAI